MRVPPSITRNDCQGGVSGLLSLPVADMPASHKQ
jgi:hypothetical protein